MNAQPHPAPSLMARLLSLRAKLRGADTVAAARIMFINDVHAILPYDQAILWIDDAVPVTLSSVGKPDAKAPHVQQLKTLFQKTLSRVTVSGLVAGADLARVDIFRDHHGLWCPLSGQRGGLLLVQTGKPYSPAQQEMLELLFQSVWSALGIGSHGKARQSRTLPRLRSVLGLALLAGGVFATTQITIPQTTLAPAEIVSSATFYVKAPADGFVADILVDPGQQVAKDQVIATLDQARLSASLDIARAEERKLRVEYEQETLKAFDQENAQMRVVDLQGQLAEKREQIAFLQDQIDRFAIKAPKDGVVVLNSVEELKGTPVRTGQTLFQIVDPAALEINAWMNVQNAIDVTQDDDIAVFLNANPFQPVHGRITYINPRATQREDGTVGYLVQAQLIDPPADLDLGSRGRARITSGDTTVFKWVMRKPIAWFRQTLGV